MMETDEPDDAPADRRYRLQSAFTPRSETDIRVSPSGAFTARVGEWRATLVGGLFDDPSLHVDAIHGSRALLFDLGEAHRYPTRVLNRVSDIFISHAHLDHFAGFVTFLRTRVHNGGPCRLWGPVGLAERVASLVDGFTWDRLEPGDGPVFVVGEYDGRRLRRTRISPLAAPEVLDRRNIPDDVIRDEARVQFRARVLEHGTDSVAWSLREKATLNVRADRLEGDFPPGAWLGELKRLFSKGEHDALLETPTGHRATVDELADHLLMVRPGEQLVYATDFADTPANREKVVALAEGAEVLFCESFYAEAEAARASEYRHLTTRACAEIAAQAGVGRLVPFHFSSRYETDPGRLYEEILSTFDRVRVPREILDQRDATSSTAPSGSDDDG